MRGRELMYNQKQERSEIERDTSLEKDQKNVSEEEIRGCQRERMTRINAVFGGLKSTSA